MSEGSFPPFEVFRSNFSPFSVIKRAAYRAARRFRRGQPEDTAKPDPGLRSRAASAIREHENFYATLFDRAERLRARAERLEREGTPSESAQNRAERAEGELSSVLASLRSSFAVSVGDGRGKDAFDAEIKNRYPGLRVPETSS